MQVIIEVDPHKASHTAVAIDSNEDRLDCKKVRASRSQVEQLLAWAEPHRARLWAVAGADGMGYLLAQQLVASGEHVVNVPATLAARNCVLGSGRSSKTDPNDALSVAVTALSTAGLHQVRPVGHSEVLRVLAKRNTDIGTHRTKLVMRVRFPSPAPDGPRWRFRRAVRPQQPCLLQVRQEPVHFRNRHTAPGHVPHTGFPERRTGGLQNSEPAVVPGPD